jgi:dienelactone hydrolase
MRALPFALLLALVASARADAPAAPTEITLAGKAGKLQAWLWRPAGPGPFPALVYNHGSEPDPQAGTLSAIGPFFTRNGWAVLFPYRRGAGRSEGTWWGKRVEGQPDREQATIAALVEDNDDVIAALDWLRAQPWVAHDQLAVAGCSFGGIETLLTAERPVAGLRAAVDFAGGAMAWASNPRLRQRLQSAAESARVPIFFVQAENDFNTAPSKILSEAMRKKGLPLRVRIFPSYGSSHRDGHHGFCTQGADVWGADVLDFLRTRK